MFITIKNTIINVNDVSFIKLYDDNKKNIEAPFIKVKFKDDMFVVIKLDSVDEAKEEFYKISSYIHKKYNSNRINIYPDITIDKNMNINEIADELSKRMRNILNA